MPWWQPSWKPIVVYIRLYVTTGNTVSEDNGLIDDMTFINNILLTKFSIIGCKCANILKNYDKSIATRDCTNAHNDM